MGANFFSFRSFRTAWGDWGIVFLFLESKGNNPTLSPAKSSRSYFHKLFKLNFVYIINNVIIRSDAIDLPLFAWQRYSPRRGKPMTFR
jgi:hypothetical protein